VLQADTLLIMTMVPVVALTLLSDSFLTVQTY
jgi:hypothetical protein